jgi:hypothetical protein
LVAHRVQKLHGDKRIAMLVVNFVDGADIRMVQCRGGLRFALKASEGLHIFGNVVRQELKGHKAVQLYVLGLIDHTHTTAAQFLDDAVVRDGLANHGWRVVSWRGMLGRALGQVNLTGRNVNQPSPWVAQEREARKSQWSATHWPAQVVSQRPSDALPNPPVLAFLAFAAIKIGMSGWHLSTG